MRAHRLHTLVLALACVLAPWQALAGDAHGEPDAHAAPARAAESKGTDAKAAEAKAAEAKAGSAKATGRAEDPLELVRQRLAEKLAARQATETGAQNLVRIPARAKPEPASPPVRLARAAPSGHGAEEPEAAGRSFEGRDVHWAYEGSTGPDVWGQLKPEFTTCAIGRRQSPIDIRDGFKVQLEPIRFDYRNSGFRVIDNGHTIQVNLSGGNTITVGGRRFELVQFHFHRPSEERIDGRASDMVAHLVHKDLDGNLAVVAVLLDRGSAQAVVQTVWNNLPLERNVEQAGSGGIDLNALLPEDRSYFTYMGSLTTPPCTEGVLWMVMKKPVPISPEQIEIFARLYPMNARPVQRASGRVIKESQ